MCIRKNSCCLHKKIKRRYSPIYRLFLTHVKHPADAKTWHQEASKHSQAGSTTATSLLQSAEPKFIFQGSHWDFTALDKGAKEFFFLKCDCVELSTEPNICNMEIIIVSQASPGIFCLDGGRGVFKRILWRTATSAKRRIQPHFRKSKMSSIASCLHLKACWKEPQGSRASSTAWSSPAKAEQCQHRCFNVHNIYKPDTCRQFIWNF